MSEKGEGERPIKARYRPEGSIPPGPCEKQQGSELRAVTLEDRA